MLVCDDGKKLGGHRGRLEVQAAVRLCKRFGSALLSRFPFWDAGEQKQ